MVFQTVTKNSWHRLFKFADKITLGCEYSSKAVECYLFAVLCFGAVQNVSSSKVSWREAIQMKLFTEYLVKCLFLYIVHKEEKRLFYTTTLTWALGSFSLLSKHRNRNKKKGDRPSQNYRLHSHTDSNLSALWIVV